MSREEPASVWRHVHAARAELAEDLTGLTTEQWGHRSLCPGWDVEHVVAHLTAAASVGRLRWIRSILAARLRPDVHNERRLREHLGAAPQETLARFRAVVDSTVAPTRDIAAYLGEVLVHSQDIRVPLGLEREPAVEPLTLVADFFAGRDFTVPSRSLTKGLRLRATDGPFSAGGGGPEVLGPTVALVMTMAGRRAYVGALEGDGVLVLEKRLGLMG
jgi:uncharacterized protein (TIGR03083 family)